MAIDLLNQVIAEPGPPAKAPAQASPDMLKMLNQVTASAQDHQPELSRPLPETPGLLDQRASAAQQTQPRTPDASSQLPPETPRLLDQRIPTPEVKQHTSSDTAPDLTGLFAQDQATVPRPQAQDEQNTRREARERKAAPKDNTLDLLAEISREREQLDS